MQNRKLRKFLAALLTLILAFAVLCPASLAASFDVKINSSSAKVYAKPSTSAASIYGKLGAKLTCVGYSGGWACVKYKSNYGFMKVKYLNLVDRIKAYTKESTKIYSKAGSGSTITVPMGTTVYVNGYDDGYARVQNKGGSITGYVKTSKLSTNSAYKEYAENGGGGGSTGNLTKAQKLIAVAYSFIGTPYGYDEPKSFNCSSFVRYCYKQIGYSLESNAAKQAADSSMTKITSVNSLQMGDVLCFDTDGDGTCDHTAIYVADDYFVEASQNAGMVHENSFSSYYKSAFMWARRVKG